MVDALKHPCAEPAFIGGYSRRYRSPGYKPTLIRSRLGVPKALTLFYTSQRLGGMARTTVGGAPQAHMKGLRLMSAWGQSRRFGRTSDASGSPLTADIWVDAGIRRCGPLPDSCVATKSTAIRSPRRRAQAGSPGIVARAILLSFD